MAQNYANDLKMSEIWKVILAMTYGMTKYVCIFLYYVIEKILQRHKHKIILLYF